jgi:hypothetical protein
MDRVRVGFLGVKPEYQHAGVAAGSSSSTSTSRSARSTSGARWAGSWRRTRR